MPKSSILVSSDHNTFTQFSSESFRCLLANFRWACTCAFLRRGTLRRLQDFSPSRHSVLPIVFLVTMVPAALRSLTRSSRVVLGWFLTVLMIIETPRGEILVWNLIDWVLLWTGCLLYRYQAEIRSTPFKRVLLISAPYLYKIHLGARNLADW